MPNRPQHASTINTGREAAANRDVISSTTWEATSSAAGLEVDSFPEEVSEEVWAEGSGSLSSGGGAEWG